MEKTHISEINLKIDPDDFESRKKDTLRYFQTKRSREFGNIRKIHWNQGKKQVAENMKLAQVLQT